MLQDHMGTEKVKRAVHKSSVAASASPPARRAPAPAQSVGNDKGETLGRDATPATESWPQRGNLL
jgi:hypothetical protein